jgi:haloalkane dehalogenase
MAKSFGQIPQPNITMENNAFPGRGMYLSVVDRKKFLSDTMQHYEDVIPDTDDRRLTWQWPRSIPINASTDIAKNFFQRLEEGVKGLKLPSLIIWGREDKVFEPEVFAKKWLEIWPHSEGIHFVTGDHFLQEDSGKEIGFILAEFATQHGLTAGRPA